MHDKFLYNRETDTYTVDKFLDDVQTRYGGVDSVLLWPTYPNIGVDDRNQYEMHESLPGGLDALKDLIDQFHAHNVLVLLPLNPWDHGTRDSGMADYEALIKLIQRVGADGFNGDTMNGVNSSYWNEAISEYPIIIEPETMSNENAYESDGEKDLETNLWSWGYWQYESAPSVAAYKALTGENGSTATTLSWQGWRHVNFLLTQPSLQAVNISPTYAKGGLLTTLKGFKMLSSTAPGLRAGR